MTLLLMLVVVSVGLSSFIHSHGRLVPYVHLSARQFAGVFSGGQRTLTNLMVWGVRFVTLFGLALVGALFALVLLVRLIEHVA